MGVSTKELIEKLGTDVFETDCRPDRRDDHGIETPEYIQREIEKRAAKRQDASRTVSSEKDE